MPTNVHTSLLLQGVIADRPDANTVIQGAIYFATDERRWYQGTGPSNTWLDWGGPYQPEDAELTALAGLTSAANKGIQFTGSGTAGTYDLTTAGKALLDDADAAAQRTTLGLGTAAVKDADTDTTLAANSDAKVATQKATKSYVDAAVASGGVVSSVFGRTGAVVKNAGDYAVADITGAAPTASPTFTGTVTVPTPSPGDNSTKAASTAYVQLELAAAVNGLSWKHRVRAASTANVTLASAVENGDTLDGVTLATGDRILLKDQSSGSENGIYVVAASGAPARAPDADSGAEMVNATVFVSEGTANADTAWTCTNNATPTLGSTSLAFAQIGAGTAYTADESTLHLSGTTFSAKTNGIGDSQIRQSAGLSLIGRSANSTGNVADITAGADKDVLRRNGTSIGFGTIHADAVGAGVLAMARLATGSPDGTKFVRDDGTLAVPGGNASTHFAPAGPKTPLVIGDFTARNIGSATYSTSGRDGSIALRVPNENSNIGRGYDKPTPSTPYTVIVNLGWSTPFNGTWEAGIYWYETSSTKAIAMFRYAGVQAPYVLMQLSAAGFDMGSVGATYGAGWYTGHGINFFALRDDGTNRSYWIGENEEHLVQVFSHDRTTGITPDRIGFFGTTRNNGFDVVMTIYSWREQAGSPA